MWWADEGDKMSKLSDAVKLFEEWQEKSPSEEKNLSDTKTVKINTDGGVYIIEGCPNEVKKWIILDATEAEALGAWFKDILE